MASSANTPKGALYMVRCNNLLIIITNNFLSSFFFFKSNNLLGKEASKYEHIHV